MDRNAAKERKKVAAAVVDLQQEQGLTGNPVVDARFQQLEKAHNQVANAFNQNHQAYGRAFLMMDIQQAVMRKVVNDILTNDLTTTELEVREWKEDGSYEDRVVKVVDWHAYGMFYQLCMSIGAGLNAFYTADQEKAVNTPDAILQETEEAGEFGDAVVFGG